MVFFPAAPVRVCVCVVVTSSPPLPILDPCRPTRRPLITVDVTQPLRILVTAAVHLVEESRLQFLGDGPAAAAADGAAVHFADRRHLGGGAGEEGLVGDVHLVAGDAFFAHLDAEVFGQFDHCGAGDAVERRREFGCVDHAVANDEDVFAAALGDIALGVEQHGFIAAAGERFVERQHRVQVIGVRLGLAHHDVHVMTGERAGAHLDAASQIFFAHVSAPGPGGDHHMSLQILGAQTHPLGAIDTHGADVAGFELVVAYHLPGGVVERRLVVRHFQAEDMRRAEQAVGVFTQTDDGRPALGLVSAYAFEYPETVMQSVGEHVHFRVAPGHQLALYPDDPVAVSHRHDESPQYVRYVTDAVQRGPSSFQYPALPSARARGAVSPYATRQTPRRGPGRARLAR